jgi:hypothetical protein
VSPGACFRRELRWGALVSGQMLVLTLIWVAWGLLWERPSVQPWLEQAGHQMEGLMVLTVVLTVPMFVAIALVLLRAFVSRSAFRSRSARFRFHAFSCYLAAAVCLVALALAQLPEIRSVLLAFAVAILPAAVLLPFLYWPRLVFASMSGLEEHADRPTPSAPRS